MSTNQQRIAAHLAAIVGSSTDAIVSKDVSGIIESWNKSAERMFGYSADEAIGQSIRMIIPRELQHEEDRILDRIRKGQRIEHFETVRRHKDGHLLDVSLTVSPILDENGKVIGASKIARDITLQKQAQATLLEYQQRLAVTLESIGDAVVTTDPEQQISFVNGVAAQLLGYPHADLMGRRLNEVFSIVSGDTRRPVENSVEQVLRYGITVTRVDHTLLLRPDGTEVPIHDRAAPMKHADGRLIGAVLVIRDVGHEHATAQMAALLSAIVDSSDDAIISKDLNGTIMSWNNGAERIFGYSAQEVIGQSIRLLIPPDRQDEEADILRRLSRGQRIEHYQSVRRKKNGQMCDISLTVSPLRDLKGRIFGASKIARDITEEKRAQRALFESQERWRVTLESIGDGVIATDMNGIVTFANSVALKLIGRISASMMGRPLEEVFPIINEESRKPVVNPIQRVIREGIVVGLANHTLLIRPDGSEVPIHDSAAPILDDTQRLRGVVLVFRALEGDLKASR